MRLSVSVLAACLCLASADIYMHVPRGSNDRLNEKSAQRANANRLFDSQNNNRGGYNAGDAGVQAAGNDESKQYRMQYFQSDGSANTVLRVEWTNQHGCGGNEDDDPQKQNCNLVMQYACQDDVDSATGTADTFRNGVRTNTQDYSRARSVNDDAAKTAQRKAGNVKQDRGLHESWDNYDQCFGRERNKGLFTADQNLRSNNGLGYSAAIYTRQNPNGDRRGYECPEERDHFPYWHPTMWKDVAILAENDTICSHYTTKSFNVQSYGECVESKGWSRWNNHAQCIENGGQWVVKHNYLDKLTQHTTEGACLADDSADTMWAIPHDANEEQCLVKLTAPECFQAPWSRNNHLGNGINGIANTYDWKLPHFPSGDTKRCIFRMRYNISTDDYDPYNTNSSYNKNGPLPNPIINDPYVNLGYDISSLRLAINTAQFGRTFQDRSHVFKLVPRPAALERQTIHNLNVRGKRGNIVQTYPAVEYDFAPTQLDMAEGDLVHIQWTGSNTHNNGNPGGDGQTGDAGEGTSGTDRSNIVQILDANDNYPLPYPMTNMWANATVKWIYHGQTGLDPQDLAVDLASVGYYRCIETAECSAGTANADQAADAKDQIQDQLNNTPASYPGVVLRFARGTYHYMCTRNNNFTNRSQKGVITVHDAATAALWAVGSAK